MAAGKRAKRTLIDEVVTFIRRYVVMTDEQALVVAVWILHTHCVDHIEQTPYLSITSPDSECGKSRLMEVLDKLCRASWMVIRPSDAVAYRYIDKVMPTLLLDEVDTIFSPQSARFHEGLRAIVDAGHRRGAKVVRAADFGRSVDYFRPFCPKALAGIGGLPDTIARRSIYVRLARKKGDEHVERFLARQVDPLAKPLKRKIEQWAKTNGERVGEARPHMPEALSDRMQEGCESLVAIGDLIGRGDDVREALLSLLTGERLDNHETKRLRLLRDMREVWEAEEARRGKKVRGLPTAVLIQRLCGIEESPWRDYYKHGPIEPQELASLLRHYGVKPRNLKMPGGKVPKGYRRDELQEVWDRYLP